jgi:rhamnulokinase
VTPERFLAFDLGAESGRAVVGTLDGGALAIEEIHRFANRPVRVLDTLYWDVVALYANLIEGMRIYSGRFGPQVASIGIDTWGVDFGLLARDGSLLQNPVCYRDRRTEGVLPELQRRLPLNELYQLTGLPFSPVHTICQLLALRLQGSPVLAPADRFLMMPDLLAYMLTGEKVCERTNACSTQVYDPRQGCWSEPILQAIGIPRTIMPELVDPGTTLGEVLGSVARDAGLKPCPVVAPCTHDTASAVAAVPGSGEDWAFLSSGTWSVVGALSNGLVSSDAAFQAGLCNELTQGAPFLCKNIMGLWLLQQARAVWEKKGQRYSYQELVELARQSRSDAALIDPDDAGFLAPPDMHQAICDFARRTGQRPPEDPGAAARSILESLALCYRHWLRKLEEVLGRRFRVLHIVGGGSLNTLLCQFTADATGLPVLAGPMEATVAGNLLVQAVARGRLESSESIRQVVRRSTQIVEYRPGGTAMWDDRYAAYLRIIGPARSAV